MSDIMGLVKKYGTDCIIAEDEDDYETIRDKRYTQIKARISAMQEVCEAAVKFEKECGIMPDSLLGKDHCAQCNLILTVRKLNEVIV